ncbi:MAG: carboxyl transferase domain-containing protein [Sphingomonadales bacterium]
MQHRGAAPSSVIPTSVDRGSEPYKRNQAANSELVRKLEDELALSRAGGGPAKIARHRERDKLLIRERIELLIDRDSAFLELSPLMAWGTEFDNGASVVNGIGVVNGVECVISGADPTIKGGSLNPYSLKKTLRGLEIALQNRLPYINLTESGGADLRFQGETFILGGQYFRSITELSKAGIPTVSIVFGPSTAGGAYVPGMSDYAIMVRGRSKVFLAGPPLVKMATGEITDDEELGGAEMHAKVSGLGDYLAEDETDAIRIARDVIGHLSWTKAGYGPTLPPIPPVHDPEELLGAVSAEPKEPFDVREVLARVLDGSLFDEFKRGYGNNLVTGWGSIHGYAVGVLGNNGVLFSADAQKGAQFIQLCNQRSIPLLFVQNITGFMVGRDYERGGIIKDGAKLINAVTNSEVPHITLMVGSSFGAGNYGMAGRAFRPRFVFTYPSHRIAVMGPAQLAGVMEMVSSQAAKARGEPWDEKKSATMRLDHERKIESESTAFHATGQGWDDAIIDPRDTRTVLGLALSAVHSAPVEGATGFGVFRM